MCSGTRAVQCIRERCEQDLSSRTPWNNVEGTASEKTVQFLWAPVNDQHLT